MLVFELQCFKHDLFALKIYSRFIHLRLYECELLVTRDVRFPELKIIRRTSAGTVTYITIGRGVPSGQKMGRAKTTRD